MQLTRRLGLVFLVGGGGGVGWGGVGALLFG